MTTKSADDKSQRDALPLSALVRAYGDAMFDCGQWDEEDPASYDAVHKRAKDAEAALLAALPSSAEGTELESEPLPEDIGCALKDAPNRSGATTAPTESTFSAIREPLALGREHLTVTGKFQSDKYPWCAAGFVPLKTTDPMARDLLATYAERRRAVDEAFADDLLAALCAKDGASDR